MRRCPYLEEYLKERHSVLRVYRLDCRVDRKSKRKCALSDSPPICVRNFEDCPLYRAEKGREDQIIRRYFVWIRRPAISPPTSSTVAGAASAVRPPGWWRPRP